MGDEIEKFRFSKNDFQKFRSNLKNETKLLKSYFDENKFISTTENVIGLELEAWLVDEKFDPAPANQEVLKGIEKATIVPELSQFNVEYVTDPYYTNSKTLTKIYDDLKSMWLELSKACDHKNCFPIAVGILPTLRTEHMTLKNMSQQNRYYALNYQLLNLRGQSPFRIDISGKEHLVQDYGNLMIESITTSLQIHKQVNLEDSKRYYNAALITCPSLVALGANAPYVMGKHLWDESRIPVFEQIINSCPHPDINLPERVTLGPGYIENSVFECFSQNIDLYKTLLPIDFASDPQQFKHVMLHNGTAWRWIRPLIGVNSQGKTHLRIEQRVPSAGPTAYDIVGNIAFYLGLLTTLATQKIPPETQLAFSDLKKSFYNASQYSLDAQVMWLDGQSWNLQKLIAEKLLPMAREGLQQMGFDDNDIQTYLNVITKRNQNLQTGSKWQQGFIKKHGPKFDELVKTYIEKQMNGVPVHEWSL